MHGPRVQKFDLQPWQHSVAALFACALLITRRPDAVFHAQFFAEDGHVWFADAYNLGWWTTLFRTQDGYFQTLPRLGAAVALLVPMAMAPLVLNLIAIAIETLPVSILLSARSSGWGSLRFRFFLACAYVILPNCQEMIAIITSSQWILALCVFLLLVASAPKGVTDRLYDISILVLSGLTGPFCFFLFPVAAFLAWKRSDKWRWFTAGLLGMLCAIQAWGMLIINPSGRSHTILGANLSSFVRILGGNVFLATLVGGNGLALNSDPNVPVFLCCVALTGAAIVAYCFVRSNLNMRLFIFLSVILLAASFISPVAYPPPGSSRWQLLLGAIGIRYWFFPSLTLAWSLLWCLQSRQVAAKTVSAILLSVMLLGIYRDWRIPPFKDFHFAEEANRFEASPAGTAITLQENPAGWNIHLVRHSPNQ